MCKLSATSLLKLEKVHPDLQKIFKEAIKDTPIDFSITCGWRGEKEQNKAFEQGNSKLKFPQSKHNKMPAMAVDAVPYPKMWDASDSEWSLLSNHILATAKKLGIKLTWGGSWKFVDKPHYEL